MKLGILKSILLENKINKIIVHSTFYVDPLIVIDAVFDTRTRSAVFLKADVTQATRTNKCNTIKSYLLDFNDTHTIYIDNVNKQNAIYTVDSSFELDKNEGILHLHATRNT